MPSRHGALAPELANTAQEALCAMHGSSVQCTAALRQSAWPGLTTSPRGINEQPPSQKQPMQCKHAAPCGLTTGTSRREGRRPRQAPARAARKTSRRKVPAAAPFRLLFSRCSSSSSGGSPAPQEGSMVPLRLFSRRSKTFKDHGRSQSGGMEPERALLDKSRWARAGKPPSKASLSRAAGRVPCSTLLLALFRCLRQGAMEEGASAVHPSIHAGKLGTDSTAGRPAVQTDSDTGRVAEAAGPTLAHQGQTGRMLTMRRSPPSS
jgi:hypothetical protein